LKHTKETDGNDHTVIMIQTENEIGMLPTARDYSVLANERFQEHVPTELMQYLERNKENLAPKAGKAVYPLPMYVNAALNRPQSQPGLNYPSGGPLPHLMDIWKAGGPSIDFLSPDFYFPDLKHWCDLYTARGIHYSFRNIVLIIPWQLKLLIHSGTMKVLVFAPFSVESSVFYSGNACF